MGSLPLSLFGARVPELVNGKSELTDVYLCGGGGGEGGGKEEEGGGKEEEGGGKEEEGEEGEGMSMLHANRAGMLC